MEPTTDPDVTAPSADPAAAPVAPATTPATDPTGSEAVTNTGDGKGQEVPFERFQEVNNRAKEAEERAAKAESRVDDFMKRFQSPQEDDVEIEDDVKQILDAYVKKNGFVTKEQMEQAQKQAELNAQAATDIQSLTAQYKESGVPYDNQKVLEYAKANNMPITSKTSLESAYFMSNRDAILEAERKRAVTNFQETGKSGAEKPTPGGGTQPEQPEVHGLKARISAARSKLA